MIQAAPALRIRRQPEDMYIVDKRDIQTPESDSNGAHPHLSLHSIARISIASFRPACPQVFYHNSREMHP